MALSFHSEARGENALKNDKSYISTDAFNNDIYTYTTRLNTQFVTVGTLANLRGTTATNCPAGRVLHLTGRRLIPSVNPMNTFPSAGGLSTQSFPGVFLVSVYDPITGFRGFIDPTSSKFARFDQNLPNTFDLGNQGAGILPLLGGKGGTLSANGVTTAAITVFKTTSAATNTATYNAGNASVGMFMPVAFDSYSAGKNVGGSIVINTTAVKTTSNIFLTLCGNNATLIAYPGATDGTFTVYIGVISAFGPTGAAIADGLCFSWLVVN